MRRYISLLSIGEACLLVWTFLCITSIAVATGSAILYIERHV